MVDISVVMPAYNAAPYLRCAVDSVLAQTAGSFEIILINDCSTDETAKLADALCAEDTRISVVHLSQNRGPSAARNEGIKRATGKYVTFTDADDWLEPNTFERCLPYMRQGTQVLNFGMCVDYENRVLKRGLTQDEIDFTPPEMRKSLILGTIDDLPRDAIDYSLAMFGSAANKMIDLGFLQENRLQFMPDIHRCEDMLFAIQIFQKAQKVQYINDELYHYRQVGTSLVHAYKPQAVARNSAYMVRLREILQNEIETDGAYNSAFTVKALKALFECLRLEVFHPDAGLTWSERKQKAAQTAALDVFNEGIQNYKYSFSAFGLPVTLRVWAIKHRVWFLVPLLEKMVAGLSNLRKKIRQIARRN